MFTLKLFRRIAGQLQTKVVSVDHVVVKEIGKRKPVTMLELWAFNDRGDYDTYYIGEAEPDMNAISDQWGWGLLENWEGNTTQHFRPASFG